MKEIQSISASHERRFGENKSCKGLDIWYHYLIFKDGTVVQTRCLDEIGYHNSKNNKTSIGVALIGNFNNEKPTQEQYDALNILLWALTETFTGAEVKPHRWRWASCPGKYFDQKQISDFLSKIITPTKSNNGSVWTYVLSRYYSPEKWQDKYFKGSYESDKAMNCGPGDCSTTANGHVLQKGEAGMVGACPEWLFGKTIYIDMGFWKQEFRCIDRGSAIIGNRIDIRAGYWNTGYYNIKNWVVKNTGTAKIYLKK